MRVTTAVCLLGLALSLSAGAAAAQTDKPSPPGQVSVRAQQYGQSPWWLNQPVLTVVGSVEQRTPANQAAFDLTFTRVEKTSAEAVRLVSEQVSNLGRVLTATYGDRIELQSRVQISPLYEQYRDKEGNRVDNAQPDKIDAYEANATLSIKVNDGFLAEAVFGVGLAALPTRVSPVSFTLVETEAQKANLYREAVVDAQRRARIAAEAAGVRLGKVRIIDPSERACALDILIQDGGNYAQAPVTPYVLPTPPPPAQPPTTSRFPLQPPSQTVSRRVCVIYAVS